MVEGNGCSDVVVVAPAAASGGGACLRGGGGGSVGSGGGRRYGVRAAEVALHRALSVIRVEVVLLDDSPHVFEIQKHAKGEALLDLVFSHLELLERDYFGLQYRDSSHCAAGESDRRWLDPLKTVKKQLRIHNKTIDTCALPVLYFRVKFWVTEPSRLTEEYTRYHVVLQLRRMLADRSLPVPATTAALLASYALQSDFGDYNVAEHGTHYVREADLLPPVPDIMLSKVIELHKLHKNQTPADAEFQFLDHARRIELYGVDIHAAQDSSERELSVGVTSLGLVVIHNGVKMNTFSWAKIIKISFKRRQFMIQLRKESSESYESVLVFTLPSYRACKCLWKSCVEHHTFFRLHAPRPPPKRQLLALGSKFWYSGRTQHQTLEEARRVLASSPSTKSFVRSPSKQASLATLGTTNGTTSSSSAAGTGSLSAKHRTTATLPGSAISSLRPRSDSCGYRVTSLPTTPKLAWAEQEKPSGEAGAAADGATAAGLTNGAGAAGVNGSKDDSLSSTTAADDLPSSALLRASPSPGRPSTPAHLPSTLSVLPSTTPPPTASRASSSSRAPSKASSYEPSKDSSSSKASSRAPSEAPSDQLPVSVTLVAPLATDEEVEADLPSSSSSSTSSTSSASDTSVCDVLQGGVSEESEHGLITIRIQPSASGRFAGKFGFNVKGGADQEAPVLVSKVTAGSPADTCYPRLNEGDQVLLINGREVSNMTHNQVVNSILASREGHSGELVLTVRQNVYVGDVSSDEPAYRYVPESVQQLSQGGGATSPAAAAVTPAHSPHQLKESILLLQEGLESGSLVAKFEMLYRRKPGLPMDIARHPSNESRNRYRDISPYDSTRVILQHTGDADATPTNSCPLPSNDYINASHVVMEIPGSGITNRYIASQGPLIATCGHFWQMVWEQQSTLLVMLTTCIEQGRSKCQQYWPEPNCSGDYGPVNVACDLQKSKPGFASREFTVIHKQTGQKRKITHLQYLSWPDHGVPEHSTDFLTFVKEVRDLRAGEAGDHPTLVHCSAGIGRTGVLILMETAQCLIEAQQPVYPLDLVQRMRDQRAMMIQTPGQFRFVCEAISRVYSEKLVQPLPQYSNR